MMENDLVIDKMITIDKFGMPKAPNLKQLLNKDIRQLYIRDRSEDKSMYIKECGVIYYLGDPKSPVKQQGLGYTESLKEAIKNYDLPSNYQPDLLVVRLIGAYYKENITKAGVVVEGLLQSLHNMSLAVNKLNEMLNEKLNASSDLGSATDIITIMNNLRIQAMAIPDVTKKLKEAKENLMYETETTTSRGGVTVTSSMIDNED